MLDGGGDQQIVKFLAYIYYHSEREVRDALSSQNEEWQVFIRFSKATMHTWSGMIEWADLL